MTLITGNGPLTLLALADHPHLRIAGSRAVPKEQPHRYLAELEQLREWSRAREYWDRAIEQMKLALDATDPDERKRLIAIAGHYRELAEATERSADRKGAERRGEK
jgi:hypothetical protein